ncbi:sugar phosphate isomerase/epimerase [Clostridium sp. NSJ-145]|uniref:sugar phosphate isomerase/epimerase family protein n=1 Tax=Clostridium sp. NSJ-145 TaxID=2897777 RepID=UPI001E38BE50|nr:sugar phosphate isomerase/epimerase [Clostridium sp. NSJ-145]
MNRIIAVNSNCYHGYSIEEALEGIHKAGFKYVELTATKGWTEHVFPDKTFKDLCDIKNKMEELDIEAIGLSGHCNLMDIERLDDFILNIELAAFFSCTYIVSSIGEAHIKDKAKSSNEMLVNNIEKLIPHLEKHNLTLVLETHGEHGTGYVLNEIVKLVNSCRVKVNYDTANVLFYSDVDMYEDIETCIENLAYMHIKDKAGERKEWNFPALGKGYIDFPLVLNKLDNHSNNCPLSIEIEFTASGPKDLEEVNTAVQDSSNYLISLGFSLT